ncbi:MAG: S8 family serine peptidase [Vicinamibacterales bacterium]
MRIRIASVAALCAMLLGPSSFSAQEAPGQFVLTASGWGAAQDAAVAAAGGAVVFSHDGAGVALATSGAPDFLARVRAASAIRSAEADRLVQWQQPSVTVDLEADAVAPGDDRYFPGVQWAPQAIDAPAAWAAGCTGAGVRVAIVDGGIYSAHPDLAANLDVAASRSFVPGQPFDNDTGTFWHGTHVAGIVAAADNTIGIVGIAPEATIVGVKVLHGGSGSFGAVIQGILYAATPSSQGGGGADIINMSLGAVFPKNDTGAGQLVAAMNKAVNYANRSGVLVVSAAGNDGLDLDHAYNYVSVPAESGAGMAVAATGPAGFALGATDFDRPATYTNYGTSVIDVAAPGGNDVLYDPSPTAPVCTRPVVSPAGTVAVPCWVFDLVLSTSRAGYTWAEGTSMASPAAAAVAALVKQSHPGISLGGLRAALRNSAVDAGKKGADPLYGKGFVNALRACQY